MTRYSWLLPGILCLAPFTCTLWGTSQHSVYREAILYDNHSDQQRSVAYGALCKVSFQGDERILDIGCGTGKITANLAGRVPYGSVLGLDINLGMITFAQKQYAPLYGNLTFTQGDAENLFLSSEFDFICSFSSLHWVLDHESLLARIYTALKPLLKTYENLGTLAKQYC